MINSLTIKNFQAHENLQLTFSDKINTIVGSSDKGKSAIIRALRWCCFNQPSGNEFLKWGSKFVESTVVVDDIEIKRGRGTENTYQLNEEVFKAFGTSNVPEPVRDLLKLNDINFQLQHDSPFWFSETSGEVSRQLNAIVDLQIIDDVLSSVNNRLRKTKTIKEDCDDRLDQLLDNQDELEFVIEANRQFQKIEVLQKQNEVTQDTKEELDLLLRKALSYRKTIRIGIKKIQTYNKINNIGEQFQKQIRIYDKLKTLLNQKDKHSCTVKQGPPDILPLSGLEEAYKQKLKEIQSIKKIMTEYTRHTQTKNTFLEQIVKYEQKIKNVVGNRCPLCDNII